MPSVGSIRKQNALALGNRNARDQPSRTASNLNGTPLCVVIRIDTGVGQEGHERRTVVIAHSSPQVIELSAGVTTTGVAIAVMR